METKPKYFSYFWDGKFFDWYKLTYKLARQIRDDYCQYFQLPKCAILIDESACELHNAMALYLKGNVVLRYEKNRLNLWSFLHELTHHLQFCLYDCEFDTDHGPTFTKAKNKTIRWSKKYISDHIKPSFLNGYKYFPKNP